MVKKGRILGQIKSKNGISTDLDKIKIIVDLPRLKNVKEVQAFMGHCGYYQWFIYMYAVIVKPIYGLIIAFEWTEECEIFFEKLKQALILAPILKALDYKKMFHVHVDALAYAVGCILAQSRDNNVDFPISYASRQLYVAERNYSTIDERDWE